MSSHSLVRNERNIVFLKINLLLLDFDFSPLTFEPGERAGRKVAQMAAATSESAGFIGSFLCFSAASLNLSAATAP